MLSEAAAAETVAPLTAQVPGAGAAAAQGKKKKRSKKNPNEVWGPEDVAQSVAAMSQSPPAIPEIKGGYEDRVGTMKAVQMHLREFLADDAGSRAWRKLTPDSRRNVIRVTSPNMPMCFGDTEVILEDGEKHDVHGISHIAPELNVTDLCDKDNFFELLRERATKSPWELAIKDLTVIQDAIKLHNFRPATPYGKTIMAMTEDSWGQMMDVQVMDPSITEMLRKGWLVDGAIAGLAIERQLNILMSLTGVVDSIRQDYLAAKSAIVPAFYGKATGMRAMPIGILLW
ncbi:hypothetical protein HKX48_006125 [Thoreauomyces humboldtii]|nr:hypothetical protein HKX48_006125 [Thoreauomyces humboldtii]